jgi:hypothetical protein
MSDGMSDVYLNFDFKNPDYRPIFVNRSKRLSKIRADKTGMFLKAHHVIYKSDPCAFIQDWMLTYDPRLKMPFIPFILFPKQKEYIYWLSNLIEIKSDGLMEKSRDVGASWLNMAFAIWALCYMPGVKVGFGSRKEKYVDCIGDPDSLFEKGRLILTKLPREFKPNYTAPFMKIMNHDTGATITGEAGDNIGRGGRNTIYLKDESAFYERPERIEAALSQNSDVKIDVSTPNGNGNPFYKKRFGGKIPVFVFDWRDDPRKDAEWYKKQQETLEPWILAQEVDRDYNASVEGICIPAKYVKAAIDFPLEPSGRKMGGLDVADEGGDKNTFFIIHGNVCVYIDGWLLGTTTDTARKAHRLAVEFGIDALNYDSIGVGAGVKGEMKSIDEKAEGANSVDYIVTGINVGSTKLPGFYSKGKLNKDMFANKKAQMWWTMRRRFERTYERLNGLKHWPDDDCISIPNHAELIAELSQPKVEFNDAGKIKIESKEKMKRRGIPSPNYADGFLLASTPPRMVFTS